MDINHTNLIAQGFPFSVNSNGTEVARAYLYLMLNDLHKQPFGLVKDVFVDESQRGGGLGPRLANETVAAAKENGCYKLITTSRDSRPKVHGLYRRLGFSDHSRNIRINL
ncbi:MAG: GNAT family N-acetyltransferase [Pseudomonadota bacterium]